MALPYVGAQHPAQQIATDPWDLFLK